MAVKNIRLKNAINNASLQVGDAVYTVTLTTPINAGINLQDPTQSLTVQNSDEDPKLVGNVKGINGAVLTVDITGNEPLADDFLMFSKNKTANNTSLVGYYAKVKLKNNSPDKAELFALSSEIAESSK